MYVLFWKLEDLEVGTNLWLVGTKNNTNEIKTTNFQFEFSAKHFLIYLDQSEDDSSS